MSAGYYRNWYGNFWATDNTLVAPADFTPFCITAPGDARLPGGGGYDVCGLADVVPSKFGLVDSVVTQASHFGDRQLVNDFFNVTLNARLANGILFGGGIDTGRSVDDRCFVVDSPQDLLNCRVVTPLSGNTQVKAFGTYPLPYDFLVSAVFQNIAGPDDSALVYQLIRDKWQAVKITAIGTPAAMPNQRHDSASAIVALRANAA